MLGCQSDSTLNGSAFPLAELASCEKQAGPTNRLWRHTPRLASSGVQISWPPVFSLRDRSCAVLVAASVQILLSLDTGLSFPDRQTAYSPEFVADGTRYGTQKP